jgi:polysaccharide biosynthesis protein PslH
MRILYITNGFPYPLTSGYLRHYFFIKELSRSHRITLLSIVNASFAPEHAAAMAPFTERIETFMARARRGSRLRKTLDRLGSWMRGEHAVMQMRTAIIELLARERFDAVVFSGKPTYRAIAGLDLPPVVADLCDAASLRFRGELRYASPWKRPLLWMEDRQVRRSERGILSQADYAVFASARDRAALVGDAAAAGLVVPNGVDLAYWRRTSRTLGSDTLVLTGAMNYPPNTDAALLLAHDILPAVRRRVPGARALIVGHSPTPALLRAGRQPGVAVTGFVDDVRPFLEEATVFVAPLRFGAGIQNKLLEALAMEIPTIASPLAAAGLRTADGEAPPVRTADEVGQYVDEIVDQFEASRLDPAPHAAGRDYVRRHFSWAASAARLSAILDDVVRGRGEAGPDVPPAS